MKRIKRILMIAALLCLIGMRGDAFAKISKIPVKTANQGVNADGFIAEFIDVGQGDAILLSCEGHNMLVDSGEDYGVVSTLISQYGALDCVVATHPHADHIGCMYRIIKKFQPQTVYMPKIDSDLACYDKMCNAAGSRICILEAGDHFTLGGARVDVLAPTSDPVSYEDINNASIVLLIEYQGKKILLMGDAEVEAETEILKSNIDVDADIIKIGHHGSASSSSDTFISRVHPEYAVISVGKDNDYGHPEKTTLDTLLKNDCVIARTDTCGNITATIKDGKIKVVGGSKNQNGFVRDENLKEAWCNTHTGKFHVRSCEGLKDANPKNFEVYAGSRKALLQEGYTACGLCKP